MIYRSALLAITALVIFASRSFGASLIFPDFSSTAGLQLNGNAAQVGNVLRVAPASAFASGSVFSSSAVTLNSQVSFSTFFSFRVSANGGIGDEDGIGADGLAFVVQTNSSTVGSAGGGIGYGGVGNSVAVEFDTFNNGPSDDNNGNHIGIGFNGNLDSNPQFNLPTGVGFADRLNNGNVRYAWVDYAGLTDQLEVRFSDTPTRPLLPILTTTTDLTTVLGSSNAFVGFTSATGSAFSNHDILSWEFRDTFSPVIQPPTAGVPEAGHSFVLMLLALCGLAMVRVVAARSMTDRP